MPFMKNGKSHKGVDHHGPSCDFEDEHEEDEDEDEGNIGHQMRTHPHQSV